MKKSDALKKLEKLAVDLNPEGSPQVIAKWILDFVEQELKMVPEENPLISWKIHPDGQMSYGEHFWESENGEET